MFQVRGIVPPRLRRHPMTLATIVGGADRIEAYPFVVALMDHLSGTPVDRAGFDSDEYERWVQVVRAVEDRFDESDAGVLTQADLLWIDTTRLPGLSHAGWVHAIAWGVDLTMWRAFPLQWQRQLGDPEVHRLDEGEWFPVSDWMLPLPPGRARPVRPSAESVRVGELPHVRRWSSEVAAGVEPIVVELHFGAAAEVRAAAEAGAVATIHANGSDEEFDVPDATSIFPVRPIVGDQGDRIASLVGRCQEHGAELVVGGEVSLTQDDLRGLQEWMDGSWVGPALVVPGSVHMVVGSEPSNVAFALRRRLPPLEHRKIVPFERATSTKTAPHREGIVPGPRVLKVWPGGWVRFAMVICRDLLDPVVRGALCRAGVNLLAVPTFSEEMSSYPVHVGEVALANQGRVVVANNPARFGGRVVSPIAVFGQPVRGRSTQPVFLAEQASPDRGFSIDAIGEDPRWFEEP